MGTPAYSGNTIARSVYDEDLRAIRTTDAAVAAGAGAENSVKVTIPNSSTEIGSAAGSRKSGILIIFWIALQLMSKKLMQI